MLGKPTDMPRKSVLLGTSPAVRIRFLKNGSLPFMLMAVSCEPQGVSWSSGTTVAGCSEAIGQRGEGPVLTC